MKKWLIGAIAAAACGCGQVATLNMSNPLIAGKVPQNKILCPDKQLESANGLKPGSLVDEASIAHFDAEKICFNLQMQVDGAHVNLASPQAWTVRLTGEPYFEDDAPKFSETTEHKQDVREGEKVERSATTQRICDDNTESCVTKTRVQAQRRSVDVNVSSGSGMVCFANKGHVTKQTSNLRLTLADPSSMGHQVTFEWNFTDAQDSRPK